MKTITIPFIPPSKKNALRPSKTTDRLYYDPKYRRNLDAMVAFLRGLNKIPPGRAVKVYLDVQGKQGECKVSVAELQEYDLPRHPDLDGILTSVLDGLKKAGIIEDDSRVIDINARLSK